MTSFTAELESGGKRQTQSAGVAMWVVRSTLSRVRDLFLPRAQSDDTVAMQMLKRHGTGVNPVKMRDGQKGDDSLRRWLRAQYGASDVLFASRSVAEGNNGARGERAKNDFPPSVLSSNGVVFSPRTFDVSPRSEAGGSACKKPRPLDLLTTVNKGDKVLDILASPKLAAAVHFKQSPHFVQVRQLEVVPSKPLSKYNMEAAWNLQTVACAPSQACCDFLQATRAVMQTHSPVLADLGTGGAYFLSGECGNVAVFKPVDEEPRAVNNPKGLGPTGMIFEEGLKKGTRPGEGALKEYAAYLIDHGGYCGVPLTLLVSLSQDGECEQKLGSLQEFVVHDFDAEECGSALFPIEDVHKLCLLDLRIANTDRNGQNVLVTHSGEAGWKLTPIDHGYGFPDSFEDVCFEWMFWPQAKRKFSPEMAEYIKGLDAERDVQLLAQHGVSLRRECLDLFRFCTHLLKWAVSRGFTPFDIACLLCGREGEATGGKLPSAQVIYSCVQELSGGGVVLTEDITFEVLESYAALAILEG